MKLEQKLIVWSEKGQLLEIHLLEKTACSTPKSRLLDTVRADVKKMKTARKSKKRHFEQMRVLDQNEQLLELQLLDKSIEKYQLLEL